MLRKPRLNQLYYVPDVSTKDNFSFVLGTTPGGGTDPLLHLKCNSVVVPNRSNEPIVVNLFGHRVHHRGQDTSNKTLNVTYFEDAFFNTTKALRRWYKFIHHEEFGVSQGTKLNYGVECFIVLYNHQGFPVYSFQIKNLWPINVAEIDLSGDSTTPIINNVTFAFDELHDESKIATGFGFSIGSNGVTGSFGVDLGPLGRIDLDLVLGPGGVNARSRLGNVFGGRGVGVGF